MSGPGGTPTGLAKRLLDLRPSSDVLAVLSEPEIMALAEGLEEVSCAPDEVLTTGDDLDGLVYLLLDGEFDIVSQSGAVASRVSPGGILGVAALFLAGSCRAGRFKCRVASSLAAMPLAQFDALLANHPLLQTQLSKAALRAARHDQLHHHLDHIFGPFGVFAADILAQLEDHVEWRSLKAGQTLVNDGDPGDAVYIIMSGRLRATVTTPAGRERIISELVRGETVGETALLTGGGHTSTVRAVRDADVARLSKRAFFLLIERRPRSLTRVARIMAERLTQTLLYHDPKRIPPACVALFPTGTAVDLMDLGRRLLEALPGNVSTTLLTSEGVDQSLGRAGVAQSTESDAASVRLCEWLTEQEVSSDLVIYVADHDWTAWSQRCARQSDLVLQIADATTEPCPGPAARALIECDDDMTERALVLVHPRETDRPRGTASWLRGYALTDHHHVRADVPADLERLARVISGRAVGLVFGGGGARGFAQVGVIRALEELGIPVDMIGGSSIGASLAFPKAAGWTADAIQDNLRNNWGKLLDITLPLASLMSGRRINTLIENFSGDWDIEDLWLPYFAVTTNLTTAQSVVLRRGNAAHAIRSSVSIPGVLPPVPAGEDLLVDGGVLNNMPIDVMRELNPFGKVIAIDVFAPRGPAAKLDYGKSLSGWRLALNRVLPWQKRMKVPGLSTTIMRSLILSAGRARDEMVREGIADYYQNIHVRGVGMLQFDAVDKSVELGYESSIGPLKEWLESGGLD